MATNLPEFNPTEIEINAEAYTTFYAPLSSYPEFELGLVHDKPTLQDGNVLGGTAFGGTFEVVGSPLSKAETRILALRATGLHTSEIMKALHVAETTVRTQYKAAIRILGGHSVNSAIVAAFRGNAEYPQHDPFFIPSPYGSFEGHISQAELPVIDGLARGLSPSEIAAELWLHESTIRTHIKNLGYRLMLEGNNLTRLISIAHLTDAIYERNADANPDAPLVPRLRTLESAENEGSEDSMLVAV